MWVCEAKGMLPLLVLACAPMIADGTGLVKASFPDVRSGAVGREGELVLPWTGRNIEVRARGLG